MSLLTKNIIIISLILVSLGISTFHWFFVDKIMSANECMSENCVYSSSQLIPPETQVILNVLIALFSLFMAVFASLNVSNVAAILGRYNVFKKRDDTFCHKFYSWLKILEKRDPRATLAPARFDS